MTYELAKQLKDAGFEMSQTVPTTEAYHDGKKDWIIPNLSELIEACGDGFGSLVSHEKQYKAYLPQNILRNEEYQDVKWCSTPEQAVANLWLELNK